MIEDVETLLSKIAPFGMSRADYDDAVVLATAAANIFRRHEQEIAAQMKWQKNGLGKTVLVPDGVPSLEEQAMLDANMREMLEAKQPPSGQFWDPNSTIMAVGHPVSTKAEWESIKKANKWVESTPKTDTGGDVRTSSKVDVRKIAEKAVEEAQRDIAQGKPIDKIETGLSRNMASPKEKVNPEEELREIAGADLDDPVAVTSTVTKPVRSDKTPGGEAAYSPDDLIADAKERIFSRSR